MAVYQDINQVKVGVFDKVREYYREDKYLGGLIKVFKTEHMDRIGREVAIIIHELDRYDLIKINGIEYSPKATDSTNYKEE
jgi:hypothetical protein